ncbi:tannase/feruloyl esterase family alpha/beta hydrolase [Variovorax sp. J22R24]|uniref:tannase/feruloyl esterase family alpha/beta hydrolase n=1 Tax=Variovorax gracilis TaxID=3053502 RepID=UPI002575E587|nr:tannase/feruloyl esterase family alpha/beta hydrolase [Variovorax sp. J22R24]MDM0110034.1 tannase/feruloyl esterase family alpha/beta hydrolase [Variovorax sp. J22R24]
MHFTRSASLIAMLAAAGCGGGGHNGFFAATPATPAPVVTTPAPTLAEKCATFAGQALGGGATVEDAQVVAAAGAQPEYCVVHAKLDGSTLRFEARMPTSGWNGKIAFLGGGGFDGAMPVATDPQFSESILTERYATLGTNGGYDYPGARGLDYFKAAFALNPEQLADFTYRSEHRALPPGKALVASFFGTPASRSYFEGCSMGGHDALMQAQRYPEDFDGIVARAPAGNIMGLFMQFNRISKRVRTPANSLDAAKQALLANAVLAQCDGLDGASDGIISRPGACHYDPAPLRCAAGADTGDDCLSDAQIGTVDAVTSSIASADGKWTHPGYNPGAENTAKGWGEYIWPSAAFGGNSVQGLFSDGFVRSFITQDPNYDTLTWNYDDWLPRMGVVGGMFEAFDPNLAPLNARGAKLILWNGTTDSSVSPRDTERYYDNVVGALGQAKADQTVELFMAPGVGHCYGGPGPDKVDLLKAMATWVEQGTPASAQSLVHRKVDASGATTATRPLCKYPAYPRYKGSGDMNDAASFACSTS